MREAGEGARVAVTRAGRDLEIIDSPALRAALSEAAPLTKEQIEEWAMAFRQPPRADDQSGGRLGPRYFARWDEEGFDGPCLRALSRDYGQFGRASADAFRFMGRVFARVSAAILSDRDEAFGLGDQGWAYGMELRLVEDPRSWARAIASERARAKGRVMGPQEADWPTVELMDPEELAVSLRESWELEASIKRAPGRSRPGL